MFPLIDFVSHPELCAQVVGQFAFMKAMSVHSDSNYDRLQKLDLNDVYKKADEYFIQFTSIEELIETAHCTLELKITEFLSQWKHIVDVTAIQQNIHSDLFIQDQWPAKQ